MKFKYIGDPRDDYSGASTVTVFGVTFEKGELTEVPDNLVKKFEGHNHFAKEGSDEDDAYVEDRQRAEALSKDEIKAILTERGVAFNPNLGEKKLVDLLMDNGGPPAAGE